MLRVNQSRPPEIILASTSPYRSDLLIKLGVQFEQIDPSYIEKDRPDELPSEKASRHALGKATSVSADISTNSPFIVIGSDQVVHLGKLVLSKPGNHDVAAAQLKACSGNWVTFTTAICLANEAGQIFKAFECFRIKYRDLSPSDIARYLEIDEPFDCAGSIKIEAAGIRLLEDTDGRDINIVHGLPLILLQDSLRIFFNYIL